MLTPALLSVKADDSAVGYWRLGKELKRIHLVQTRRVLHHPGYFGRPYTKKLRKENLRLQVRE